ncbi:hypothetical protein SAMN00768000_0350 [Sulfobacillus thermosulfidooxidans DSM 9293]|uniref:SnoaL-like domain-containing protein n=1 Tax=Sulfobacillus thermosulfidooxidans (strain DSM 9293 / VKM B-1269 / AT-1) TaxID=929705 RepID=A0A1W1W7G1_SULTA|nr:nuclear transport factor 2 family protein [Sulfobacillus thermosulfidooxidans]SMC02132.1 hypothetical protein SAMN00768000_0350 [Sulfobacillus thermosulfidooxidans DSM 9293]
MSVQDYRVLVERYYHSVDQNDLPTLFSLFDDQIIYKRPGYPVLAGKEQFMEFYKGTRIIESGAHTLTHILVDGDHVCVQGSFQGVLKDGRVIETEFADIFVIHDGKIVERHTYFDGIQV